MKQNLIMDIVQGMLPYLNNAQTQRLQEVLQHTLFDYEVAKTESDKGLSEQNLVELFLSAKRIEGCSEKTLKYYKATIQAMIDMLASTGMRVGEMVLLNREDIDFNERECVVFGKGDKERVVYFDARTKIHLQNYLQSRRDNNPALFVSLKAPYERLKIGGIEVRLRNFGKQLGLSKVHPHKFRRTLATMAIDKGMPIEQLQQLLGHRKIDTTLQYAMVKQSNVKLAHRKYIG